MFASIDRIAKSGFNHSYILSAVLALAASACFASPIPVAIWDGDFSNVKTNGYTLSLNGNSTNDACSVITINQSVGVTVSKDEGTFPTGFTVLFKYSDLNLALSEKQVLATSNLTDSNDRTGASINETGLSCGIWAGSSWNNSGTYNTMTSSQTAGVLAFAHYSTTTYDGTGTKLYCLKDGSCTTILDAGTLGSDADKTKYLGFSVGGRTAAASGFSAATGMKIYAIAAFEGILSEADMCEYTQATLEMGADTSFSAINAALASLSPFKDHIKVYVPNGATVSVDSVLNRHVCFYCLDGGSITLSAASQPAASYFTNVDFSGVSGAVKRSWLPTPGVVGFNFRSANGTDVSGALATADNWIHDNNSASGTSTSMFADGLSTLKWSSGGTYSFSGSTILCGYLDDGANGGNGATVTLSNVPYEAYDVIVYCSSDTGNGDFLAKTVNGTAYTWDSAAGAVVAGNATWGKTSLSIPVYGVNALRIKNLSGPLTIYGGARVGSSTSRGGIAAIEIMPPNTPDNIPVYTLTLNGTATTWSKGTWTLNSQTVDAPASGYVEIVATASTTLTIDQAVSLADLKVRGGENVVVNVATNDTGSFFAVKATIQSGVFQQGSPAILGATPSIVVASGATFDLNGQAVDEANKFLIAGAGTENWPWAFTSSGGENPLGTVRSLSLGADATIGGANRIRFGKSGTQSPIAFNTFTLTKTGAGELVLCNARSVVGGTGTLDVAGGEVTFSEFTCLDGYEDNYAHTTVIVREGTTIRNNTNRFIWMDTLNWLGGDVISTMPFAVTNAFEGAGTTAKLRFASGAQATLTGDLVITNSLELGSHGQNTGDLSFVKADGADPVVVTVSGTFSSAGSVSVGAGVTFNVGTSRPTATITVAQGGTLAAQLQTASDVIALSTSAQPANVILYDANGDVVSNARISYSDGTLTIMPPVPTLPASGTVAFDTATNWENEAIPSNDGDAIIELADDATITVSGTYTLGSLTITGSGVVTFSGEGTITAVNISVKNGATFTCNANISATTGISLDAGTVLRLDGVTENAAISGAGAVETYGTVVLAHANTMTGGITVKPGSALSTTAAGGYGEYQTGWAYTAQRQVVVEDGGTVDINNVANNDGAVALTIAGKGILSGDVYSGAVTYSGTAAITSGSRQISSLVLTGDALVDLGAGWGLVHSGWGNARLGLSGYTLTVRGTGTFPVVNANNGAATTGTLVLDGAKLELSNAASNLTNVNIVAKGCATINLAMAPSALGSLTLKPSASAGTTASSWNLPSGFVPSIDTSNVDPAGLKDGQVLTLFTAPSATELTAETIAVKAGGRYTTAISGNTVTATVKALANFMHYDFNAANSIATDSTYNFGNLNPTFVNSKNGKAGVFNSSYKPYYGSNTSGKSPFYAGEMTVTMLLKVKEANNTILWNFGSGWDVGMALIAKDSSTMSVVSWTGGAAGSDVVSATDIADLMNKWHFVTIVANANGTTLYVDGTSATVGTVLPGGISGQGQFGSIHGTAKNYNAVSDDGYLLDDWRVYDATLSHAEIRAIKRELCPDPLFIRLK